MTRPPLSLVDLVAGRGIRGPVDMWMVAAASEHKVQGLLKSALETEALEADPRAIEALEASDVSAWARNQLLAQATVAIFEIARELAIDLAVIKGASLEHRWYSRAGERPSWDIDLLLAPWHRPRVGELIAALQPEHSLLGHLPTAMNGRGLQSIDLGFNGLPVDLHLDPLKLEVVPTRHPEALWEHSRFIDLAGFGNIRVLSPESTYLLAGLHINKDRFRYLLGYADMVRIGATPGLDRDLVLAWGRAEGIDTAWKAAEQAVLSDLGLSAGSGRRSLPTLFWMGIWRPSTRLLGSEGKVRFRYRQFLIPALDPRRWVDVVIGWSRRLFPPGWAIERLYPDTRGPYWRRLVTGRFRVRVRRRGQRRSSRGVV